MGLISVGGTIQWPQATWRGIAAPTRSTLVSLTSVGGKYSAILVAPQTGRIDAILIRTGTVSGSGVQVTGAVQGVDGATGDSDGANAGGSSPSSPVSISSDTAYRLPLSTGASITKGDLLSLVVEVAAGTTPQVTLLTDGWTQAFPYGVVNNGSVVKRTNRPLIALEYSTGYQHTPDVNPMVDPYTTSTFNNSGTSRRALKATLPFGGVVSGFWLMGSLGGDANMHLRDASDNVLATCFLDKDVTGSNVGYREHSFAPGITLSANDVVRLSLEPSSSTTISIYEYTFPSGFYSLPNPVNLLQGGLAAVLSTWNGASWADSTGARPMVGLLFDEIHDGAGGASTGFPRGRT